MSEESVTTKWLFALVAPYAVAVSLLYLFGYWSTFGIEVLQYASLQDVLKLSIYPMVAGVALSSGFILFRSLVFDIEHIKRDEPENIFFMVSSTVAKWIVGVEVLGAGLVVLFVSEPMKSILAGGLVGLSLLMTFHDVPILAPFIKNSVLRRLFIAIAVLVFCGAFGRGRSDAHLILSGKKAKVVSTKIFREMATQTFSSKGLLEGHDFLKYLGTAGEFFFFSTLDNSKTYTVKYSDLHFLELVDINVTRISPTVEPPVE